MDVQPGRPGLRPLPRPPCAAVSLLFLFLFFCVSSSCCFPGEPPFFISDNGAARQHFFFSPRPPSPQAPPPPPQVPVGRQEDGFGFLSETEILSRTRAEKIKTLLRLKGCGSLLAAVKK